MRRLLFATRRVLFGLSFRCLSAIYHVKTFMLQDRRNACLREALTSLWLTSDVALCYKHVKNAKVRLLHTCFSQHLLAAGLSFRMHVIVGMWTGASMVILRKQTKLETLAHGYMMYSLS